MVAYFYRSASLEDRGSLDAMDPSFPLQDGYFYSTLLSGETSRDGKKNPHLNASSWQELHQKWNFLSFWSGIRTSGLLPRGMTKEVRSPRSIKLQHTERITNILLSQVLQETQSLLNPFSHVLGIQKQFRKRGGNGIPSIHPSPAAYPRKKNSVCFWKYCV